MQWNSQISIGNKKQLAVRIETLMGKTYSVNTHDFKTRRWPKFYYVLITTIKERRKNIRSLHTSSIREPDKDFRKLVDNIEQAKTAMNIEKTESLLLKQVSIIPETNSYRNNIEDRDTQLAEKLTQLINIYKKNAIFKEKPPIKKWCNYCKRYWHSITECWQKQQDKLKLPPKHRALSKFIYQNK